ncbi:hypothetical protein ApDm4_1198 [Acetobacter pomorum]|nr:hypothetical protein ApDm4_1198 [Acetobacter pomorum]
MVCQTAVFLNAEQDMGRAPPVGDEHRPLGRCLLGPAGVLVELAA